MSTSSSIEEHNKRIDKLKKELEEFLTRPNRNKVYRKVTTARAYRKKKLSKKDKT